MSAAPLIRDLTKAEYISFRAEAIKAREEVQAYVRALRAAHYKALKLQGHTTEKAQEIAEQYARNDLKSALESWVFA